MNKLPSSEKGYQRGLIFLSGTGMIIFSILTLQHFYQANFPESIFKGSFCDISAFLNCDGSAFSPISHLAGIPIGYFGLIVGALFIMGILFPSPSFEKTNRFISFINSLGALGLLAYSLFFLNSLCLLCAGYYIFSLLIFFLFWKYHINTTKSKKPPFFKSFFQPSFKHIFVFAIITTSGAYGFHLFYETKQKAQLGGVATKIVKEYYSLTEVSNPSFISPFWIARATEKFEDAPIRVIEYADFLCPDCLFLYQQLDRLKKEYKGKINIAFQFFPLEAKCNQVVEKDLHPSSCDLSYIAASDPENFNRIHDEIFDNFKKARDPEWRLKLAQKYGVEAALTDPEIHELVQKIIDTGREYEKTSEDYAYGIRSTPTMIINNRMIIGTLPYPHLKAIFESLLQEKDKKKTQKFIEEWVDLRR